MSSVNYEFLSSLNLSDLTRLISSHPQAESVLSKAKRNEKEYDRERKAVKRAQGRELFIPPPKNIELRLRCLADPELLLTTYFPATYSEPFTDDRRDMLRSMQRATRYGGDQAIAGSRGEGKTTLAMDGSFCSMIDGSTFFPVVIGKNQDASSDELKALRERIADSERFIEDFPEIGIPLQSVGPSTANARLLTVGKQFIRMYLGVKHFALPNIPNELLPHWPDGVESVARGQILGAVGIDGRIRGFKFRSHRPTVAIIDDIEDKDSVRSDEQIAKIETIIEEDIAGMGASAERIARVYLCTTLNRKCNAYKYTDPKQKPSWNGRRYRKMIKPPSRMDLVEQYIDMRKNRSKDDPDAREAFRFWKENREEIEHDCIVSNKHSHSKKIHEDGEPVELSAVQAYYNRVADTSAKAVATEVDNDPPESAGPVGIGLTPDIVSSRINGLSKRQLPANTKVLTAAIDLGKYYCHWVVCAWWDGAGGCVVDYGFASVLGTDRSQDHAGAEPHIYQCLLNWREELLQKQFVDATGTQHKIQHVLVDSGTFTPAAYEFCRQVRGIFHPSKGIPNYRPKKMDTNRVFVGENLHAEYFPAHNIALYELDTDYWKQWVHERFLTPTFDENNMLRRGALSLYQSDSKHSLYSQHITAEELVTEFKEGKGSKTFWNKKREDNHWLDATYMAAAASQIYGIKLLGQSELEVQPRHVDKSTERKPVRPQHGVQVKKRPGGWIPKRRY